MTPETTHPTIAMDHERTNKEHFNVREELTYGAWMDYTRDEESGKTIHLVPDPENREIRLYRWVNRTERGLNERVMTRINAETWPIEDVRFLTRVDRDDRITCWCFQGYSEPGAIMHILRSMWDHADGEILKLVYYEDNCKPAFNDENFSDESPNFTEESIAFDLLGDWPERECGGIQNAYSIDNHMMARWEEGL